MIERQLKNEKGFTLVEMLVAMTIGIILLGSSIYVYTKQDSVLRDENSNVELRDFARLAMDALVPNIRLAGYGFPPGDSSTGRAAQGLTAATATSLTYRANTDNVLTYANNDATSNDNFVPAIDAVTAGFANGDNAVFFDVNNPSLWNLYPVAGVNAFNVVWAGGNLNGFNITTQTNGAPVVINKYHTISYSYNAGTQIITATDDNGTAANGDDTTTTVANNISDLTFSYFDANNVATAVVGNIRKVQISLTVVDPNDASKTAVLITNVHLRNMGI